MRVVHRMVECRPVMLVRAVGALRPQQQILRTTIVDNELHKLSAKYAVRAAADDFKFVRRRLILLAGIL